MWQKFDIFLIVALTLALIEHFFFPIQSADVILLASLSTIALIPVGLSAWRSILDRQISVDLLASIALIASLLTHEWASAAFINLMLTSARIFGDYTADNARRAIQSLLKLKPSTVRIQTEAGVVTRPIESVTLGDLVVIGLGERIPVDGTIVQGTALIDQSSLTGESLPLTRTVGDEVLSSTLNTSGTLTVRAEKVGADTTLEHIIRLVEASQAEKNTIQTRANRFANWYIGIILVISLGLFIFSGSHNLVLAFLLIACADDLAIAIPLAFSAAIGQAARRGIIIKGSRFLEGLASTRAIFFDKTGTLTTGKLSVQSVLPLSPTTPEELLSLTTALETSSTHPLAKALVNATRERSLTPLSIQNLREIPGQGVLGSIGGQDILCGRRSFLDAHGFLPTPDETRFLTTTLEQHPATHLFLARGGRLMGIITFADTLRPEATEAIQSLRGLGIERLVMLTGDHTDIAADIAGQLGLDTYQANLLPEDKVRIIREARDKQGATIMIGDGVNDAASLSLADIGIAMGAIGSDTAIEAADIALMQDDLRRLPEAIEIGRRVVRVATQNFWIWGIVNTIGLVLVFSGLLGPAGAAAYNFLTDFIPITNSLRFFTRETKKA